MADPETVMHCAQWWQVDGPILTGEQRRIVRAALRIPDSAVPFWGLMTFTLILVLSPQTLIPGTFRLALVTGGMAIGVHLFTRLIHRQPLMDFTPEIRTIIVLVTWMVMTIPLSYWPNGSVSFLFNNYFKTLAIFWLLCNTVNTLGRLRAIVWALTLMAIPLSGTAVKNFLTGVFLPNAPEVKRIFGYEAPLTGNPNDLALMLNLMLSLSLGLLLSTQKLGARAILTGIVVLEAVAVILTSSRGGFLTLIAIFATYFWKLRVLPERRWRWVVVVVAFAAIPFLPTGYSARLGSIANIGSDPTGSAQNRWSDTLVAAHFALRHPIVGAGVGMSMLALNEERGAMWTELHNVYLEYAVELGLPGLVLFLLLLRAVIKSAALVQRRSAGVPALREIFHLAGGIHTSLIAFTVAAFFHPVAYQFYFYYIAGLAVALRAVYDTEAGNLFRATATSTLDSASNGRGPC